MRTKIVLSLLIMLSMGACQAVAQVAASSSVNKAGELAAIRAESKAFVTAFNRGDAKAVAALWTDDGEYIDETGRVFAGRDAIQKEYAEFFAGNQGRKIRILIDSVRLLSDGVAIEDGRAVLEPAPRGAPGISSYTAVHVKGNGKWLMASVRDSWLETPSTHRHIADLEWLIGVWTAEEHGAKYKSVCRWVANKSFVERRYTLTHHDGSRLSGVQLIGWNAQGGHVQSWNFSSGGGHAVGVWTPSQDGWLAEIRGMTGDGAPTTSAVSLTRLDDNAYAWRSMQRAVDGVALPDGHEVVLKRQTATP